MPRSELPPGLGANFTVAGARRAGVSRGRLRATDLEAVFHGARTVRSAAGQQGGDSFYSRSHEVQRIHERARQYSPVLPSNAFFSHVTAAALWDAPLPPRLFTSVAGGGPSSAALDAEMLHVSVPWPSRALRGAGVIGHALRPELATVRRHPTSGLALASPATTWMTLVGQVTHTYDLVAIADFFVRVPRAPHGLRRRIAATPIATIAQLTAALTAGRRLGARQLAAALERVRTGASSRLETWTRLTLVDAGVPEPVLDFDVIDDDGTFLACVDMAYPHARVAVEAEGTHHASVGQWQSDIDRYARLESAGWRVVRVTSRMVFVTPSVLVERVRAALAHTTR